MKVLTLVFFHDGHSSCNQSGTDLVIYLQRIHLRHWLWMRSIFVFNLQLTNSPGGILVSPSLQCLLCNCFVKTSPLFALLIHIVVPVDIYTFFEDCRHYGKRLLYIGMTKRNLRNYASFLMFPCRTGLRILLQLHGKYCCLILVMESHKFRCPQESQLSE